MMFAWNTLLVYGDEVTIALEVTDTYLAGSITNQAVL